MAAAAATRLRALTWLVPVKITPFWFTTSTVPSALIAPWISLGFADAPTTRFSAASDAFCLNCSVVLRPTLKLSQFRMARDCVCSMVTTWRPSAALSAAPWRLPIWPARLGRPQAARRQSVRHAGAVGGRRRARGAPPAARPRPPPCGSGCPASAATAGATAPAAGWRCRRLARLPSGRRPERCTADCAAPLSANQPGLKARDCAAPRPPRRRRSAARPPPGTGGAAGARGGGRTDGRRLKRGHGVVLVCR